MCVLAQHSLSSPAPASANLKRPRSRSRSFFSPSASVSLINGIGHNETEIQHLAESIKAIFKTKNCHFCPNHSAMKHGKDYYGYTSDIVQATRQKMFHLETNEVEVSV